MKEFKKIRHEYNSILQTITCYIEEEDFKGLSEYKSTLLQKAQILNKNDLTQLAKIKDRSVLLIVYNLLAKAKATKSTLNLIIYNDIAQLCSVKSNFYSLLNDNLNRAYETAVKNAEIISLKINSDDMGLSFCFECTINGLFESVDSKKIKKDRYPDQDKSILFNTLINKDKFLQEIVIPFCYKST